jgi:hypothetical protein
MNIKIVKKKGMVISNKLIAADCIALQFLTHMTCCEERCMLVFADRFLATASCTRTLEFGALSFGTMPSVI